MTMPEAFSEVLDAAVAPVLPQLFASGAPLDEGHWKRQGYLAYLTVLHQMIRASVPLMEACRVRCLEHGSSGHRQFAEYLDGHIPEELGHDDWLLDDLQRAGLSHASVLNIVPARAIASTVGSQYYWINHDDPIALAGYIYVLEGYPPNLEQLKRASEANGIEWVVMSTLRKHANLDPFHRIELRRCLDSLSLSQRQRHVIANNSVDTVIGATACLSSGIARAYRHLPDPAVVQG
jgi:hypothetical protein